MSRVLEITALDAVKIILKMDDEDTFAGYPVVKLKKLLVAKDSTKTPEEFIGGGLDAADFVLARFARNFENLKRTKNDSSELKSLFKVESNNVDDVKRTQKKVKAPRFYRGARIED